MIDPTPTPATGETRPGRFAHLLLTAVNAFQGSSMNPGWQGKAAIVENEAMVEDDLEQIDQWATKSTRADAVELATNAKRSYVEGYERF